MARGQEDGSAPGRSGYRSLLPWQPVGNRGDRIRLAYPATLFCTAALLPGMQAHQLAVASILVSRSKCISRDPRLLVLFNKALLSSSPIYLRFAAEIITRAGTYCLTLSVLHHGELRCAYTCCNLLRHSIKSSAEL